MSLPAYRPVRHIYLRPGETVVITQLNDANPPPVDGEPEGTVEVPASSSSPLSLAPENVNSSTSQNLTQTSNVTQDSILPPPPYVPTGVVRVLAAFNRVPTPDELRMYWPYEESHVAYLVVCGARIAVLPTWELTKPLVHGISGPIFKKYDTFALALQRYTHCFN
ncbi:hypothetical protein K435DRAFT_859359 [Dendrothele bispora CBS 962.96]|uniref:Uncharacterized protein n=1 Tax=Dendrothele bispora (strain CBS 962.96) TaxID=1314807 RepID=A0A4S8M0U9_DENBC|nr:hypothetical protein K435DRAFT_859359 [Dendrothele bispora CBS 962.96]